MADEPHLLTDEQLESNLRLIKAFEYIDEILKARSEMVELLRGRFNIPPTIDLKDDQTFIKQLRFVSHKYLNMPLPQDGRLDPGAWEKLEWDGFLPHLRDAAIQWDSEHSEQVPAKKSRRASPSVESKTQRAASRQAAVKPALAAKDWTVYRWEQEAGVTSKIARKYCNGITKTLSLESRTKLSKALEIELPA